MRVPDESSTIVADVPAGVLRGTAHDGVARFLGIPFARPPVGELRWRRPEPWVRSSEPIDATRFNPVAPQLGKGDGLVDRLFRPIRGRSSEDCLYLNAWTPADAVDGRGAGGRPVLVWIHGGGFVVGAGSTFLYDGSDLARRRGIVVVTLNYRLGALGFLDLQAVDEDAEPTANLGLYDQIAAIEWVRANARALGGDVERITVVGESAGAMGLGCLVAARPDLAPRFVLQSGAAEHVSSREQAAAVAAGFLDAVGCRATDLAALRALPVEEVLRAQRSATLRNVGWGSELPWQPSIGGDLLPKHPIELLEPTRRSGSGALAARPDVIVGTNRDEWKLFAGPALHLRVQTHRALANRIVRRLGIEPAAARELLELYEGAEDGSARSPFDVWAALRTDQFFRIPAIDLAEGLSRRGCRVHAYRFDLPVPRLAGSVGACHGVEIPYLFGTYGHRLLRPIYGPDRYNGAVSERLQGLWTSFVSGHDLEREVGWPEYHRAGRATLLFGPEARVKRDPGREERRWWQRYRRRKSVGRASDGG